MTDALEEFRRLYFVGATHAALNAALASALAEHAAQREEIARLRKIEAAAREVVRGVRAWADTDDGAPNDVTDYTAALADALGPEGAKPLPGCAHEWREVADPQTGLPWQRCARCSAVRP